MDAAQARREEELVHAIESRGITFARHLVVDLESLPGAVTRRLHADAESVDRYEIHRDRVARYGEQVRRGHMANVRIDTVDDEIGDGLFAAVPFDPEALIGTYTGVVEVFDTLEAFNQASLSNGYYLRYIPDYEAERDVPVVNASRVGNHTRFVNHAHGDMANTHLRPMFLDGTWHALLVARRPIAANEEICFDYGFGYWCRKWDDLVAR